jgi:hypothetical protein
MVHAFQAIAYIQNSRVTGDHIPPPNHPTYFASQTKGKMGENKTLVFNPEK